MPLVMAPWIGCLYGGENRFGFRLLVIGESHYETCNDPEPWFGLTTRVVGRRVNGANRQRFFTTMTKILTEADVQDPDFSVWHEVVFYNYIQSFVKGSPTKRQWEEAKGPFRTVLEYLRPDAVLVASRRAGRRIRREHRCLLDGIEFDVMAHPRYGLGNDKRVRVFRELINRTQQKTKSTGDEV